MSEFFLLHLAAHWSSWSQQN